MSAQIPWRAAAALYIFALAVILAWIGPSVITAPWDPFILVNGAARLLEGQAAHTDGYNPIGVLTYFIVSLGMRLDPGSAMGAVSTGNIIFMTLVAAWGAWIALARLPAWQAAAFIVFVTTLIVSPRPIGYAPEITSYAMLYNRYGWALLSLLAIQVLFPRSENAQEHRRQTWEALSAGMLWALLFYTKVTFAVFAAALLAAAFILSPTWRRSAPFVAVGAAAVVLLLWLLARVSPLAYVEDILLASQVQSLDHRLGGLRGLFPLGLLSIGVIVAMWALAMNATAWRRGRPEMQDLRLTLLLALIGALTLLVTAGNAGERGEMPILFVAALLLLNAPRAPNGRAWRQRALVVATLLLFAIPVLRDWGAIAHSAAQRSYRLTEAPAAQRFDSRNLSDFVVPASSSWATMFWRARQTPDRINDGLRLLRPIITAESRIFVLALTDPFSYALDLPQARGTPVWWDVHLSFNRDRFPAPETAFGDANLIMIPITQPSDEG